LATQRSGSVEYVIQYGSSRLTVPGRRLAVYSTRVSISPTFPASASIPHCCILNLSSRDLPEIAKQTASRCLVTELGPYTHTAEINLRIKTCSPSMRDRTRKAPTSFSGDAGKHKRCVYVKEMDDIGVKLPHDTRLERRVCVSLVSIAREIEECQALPR
jgi:hypothetical protein